MRDQVRPTKRRGLPRPLPPGRAGTPGAAGRSKQIGVPSCFSASSAWSHTEIGEGGYWSPSQYKMSRDHRHVTWFSRPSSCTPRPSFHIPRSISLILYPSARIPYSFSRTHTTDKNGHVPRGTFTNCKPKFFALEFLVEKCLYYLCAGSPCP